MIQIKVWIPYIVYMAGWRYVLYLVPFQFILLCFKMQHIYTKLFLYLAGGNGYINDYPTGRYLRDAKLYEIGAGTSEIRRLVIGRALNAEYK